MWPQERLPFLKSKDELLEQFFLRVFSMFMVTLEKILMKLNLFFEQYRQMGNFGISYRENPTILSNLKQYESLP